MMKIRTSPAKALLVTLLATSAITALFIQARIAPSRSVPRTVAQAREAYGRLPLSFEENRGQVDERVDFLARGPGYTLALSGGGALFSLSPASNDSAGNADHIRKDDAPATSSAVQPTFVQMSLVDSNAQAAAVGLNGLEGKVNYLIGNAPTRWRTDIPTFGRVRYDEVYPGIDLVYYGNQRQLEYDFLVAPGRDVRKIALEFKGADRVEIDDATGDLLVQVGKGTIRQQKPLSYQEVNGKRRKIESRYAMLEKGRVGFEVEEYDKSAPLVIDPVLVYSTYLGGSGNDAARDITVDSSGSVYVCGETNSTNFPTANAFDSTFNTGNDPADRDAFVTKLNATGTALVYSTYLGGTGTNVNLSGDDVCTGIAIDSAGNAYLAGETRSTDFPLANAFDATFGGAFEGYLTKLNAAGNALVYSTYIGGDAFDSASSVAVDSSNNPYVAGRTTSSDFPTLNPIQATFAGGGSDAFIMKFNAAGSALIYSTYLGGGAGNGFDAAFGLAIDPAGNAYITGPTISTDFPTVNPIQATFGGGTNGDGFVAKINPAGSALVYSTYLGGSGNDLPQHIIADASGNAYVTGGTESTNFPTANAFDSTLAGTSDAFVTKLNPTGSAFVYSTYLGGSAGDGGNDIRVDSAGNAYLAGFTASPDFPTVDPTQAANAGGSNDAFVAKLNAAGSALNFSTYLGGSGTDSGFALAVDSAGSMYVAGITTSTNFPTLNPVQAANGGGEDAFVAKLAPDAPAPTPTSTPTSTPTPTPTATPTPTPTPTPAQLLNISTRVHVGVDDNVMIGGFIIRGNAAKPVVLRALGPSLTSMSVPANAVLLDPILSLHGPNGELITRNDNWKDDQRSLIEGTIYQPSDDRESVIVATLLPESYTAIVTGKNRTTGIGVVEVYDNNPSVDSQLANISTRGLVSNGDAVIIGGFILGGPNPGDRRVGLRALGPSLAAFGVPNTLQDPFLELKNENGTTLLSNDDWQQNQAADVTAAGLAPADVRESAIIATLPAGHYFAVVQGKSGQTGVALVEIYRLQ